MQPPALHYLHPSPLPLPLPQLAPHAGPAALPEEGQVLAGHHGRPVGLHRRLQALGGLLGGLRQAHLLLAPEPPLHHVQQLLALAQLAELLPGAPALQLASL